MSIKNIHKHINKDFLTYEHHIFEKSLYQIAEEQRIRVNTLKNYCKKFDIEEIHVCTDCKTKKDLWIKKVANQHNCNKIIICDICISCMSKKKSKNIKKTLANRTPEEKQTQINKIKQHYKDNPGKKEKEQEKHKQTLKNNVIDTKNRIKKMQATKKAQGLPFNGGIGIKSQIMFSWLEEILIYLNVECSINYGLKYNNKMVKKERVVTVKKVSKNFNHRFLDCYIKINNRKINIEFDEIGHSNVIEKDKIREKEILKIIPNLEIYRVQERDWDTEPIKILLELINIVKR